MSKQELSSEQLIMICHRPWLKPREAHLYCGLKKSQFAKRAAEYGLKKTPTGYYNRSHIDQMLAGQPILNDEKLKK